MSYSLNEIEALCKRAARGAGLSWGMAEEAGRATRWLAAHGLPGPRLLCDLLTQNDGLPSAQFAPNIGNDEAAWRATSGTLCPLAAGATLNDTAERLKEGEPIEMAGLSYPLLIVPFAAWAAVHITRPVRVTWEGVEIETDGDGIWIDGPRAGIEVQQAKDVSCRPASARQDAAHRPVMRGTLDPNTLARLSDFAQRTYAPATEASRLLGAGAGTSDND